MADWSLDDPGPASTPADRECQALILGTLLPEDSPLDQDVPRARTADKTAWLAQAEAGIDALSPESAKAARHLLRSELELEPPLQHLKAARTSDDPVISRLAKALFSREAPARVPQADAVAARESYAADAAQGLPPFIRKAFIERGTYDTRFRYVDFCAMAAELPTIRRRDVCPAAPSVQRKTPPTHGELELLDAWEIAAATKALLVEGGERSDADARARVLAALPEPVATHPFVRRERFATEHLAAATGSFDSLLKRTLATATDAVQTTADLQCWESMSRFVSLSDGRFLNQLEVLRTPSVAALLQDDLRLKTVLQVDGFSRFGAAALPSNADVARLRVLEPGAVEVAAIAPAAAAIVPTRTQLFLDSSGWDVAKIEQRAHDHPDEVGAQTNLAQVRLQEGADIATARQLIDAVKIDGRTDAGTLISQSHAWASPAILFYFSGDLDTARVYYQRVIGFDTGSSSDMAARIRLSLIDGNTRAAQVIAADAVARYAEDPFRRDLSGLDLLQGRLDQAAAALAPRLPLSFDVILWEGALALNRAEMRDARATAEWLKKNDFGKFAGPEFDSGLLQIFRVMTDDRIPSDDDAAFLEDAMHQRGFTGSTTTIGLQAALKLQRLAFSKHVSAQDLAALRSAIAGSNAERFSFKPLYALAVTAAADDNDPNLAQLRNPPFTSDMDSTLAGAVLAAMDHRPDDALRYLRASRMSISASLAQTREHLIRSPDYMWALVTWALYDRTQDKRYRDAALTYARARESSAPWLAWPYALDALLSPDGPPRHTAACRAAFLDRGSAFLRLSGAVVDARGAACRQVLWQAQ